MPRPRLRKTPHGVMPYKTHPNSAKHRTDMHSGIDDTMPVPLPTIRQFPGPAGPLEALFERPSVPARIVVVFGHPHPQYGGTMHTKVVYRAAKTFLALGCAVLRFHFRGVGTSAGSWDDGVGERDDFHAALDFAASTYPDATLWAAGFSFGAWLALTCGVRDTRVTRLLGIAPPIGRRPHGVVATSPKLTHFIHGAQDELIPLDTLRRFYETVSKPKTLTVIENANHLFDGRIAELGDAIQATFEPHLQVEVKA